MSPATTIPKTVTFGISVTTKNCLVELQLTVAVTVVVVVVVIVVVVVVAAAAAEANTDQHTMSMKQIGPAKLQMSRSPVRIQQL